MIYPIETYKKIHTNGFNYTIDETINTNIITLSKQLGRPILNLKPTIPNYYLKQNGFSKHTTSLENKKIDHTDNSFKTTIIVQKTGVEKQIDQIRINLNKLTDKNYEDVVLKIYTIIDKITETNETSQEEIYKVGNIIFEIASNNIFYSKIYANLYSDLIKRYEIMKNIFVQNYKNYFKMFEVIEYVNSCDDYEKFCKVTSINEARKAISVFLLNLTKNDVLTKDELFVIVTKLFSEVLNLILFPEKTNEVHEITENIFLIFDQEMFEKHKHYKIFDNLSILEKIEIFCNSTQKEYPGLSLKTKFKYMSIIGK
jgi:hypothetical protein